MSNELALPEMQAIRDHFAGEISTIRGEFDEEKGIIRSRFCGELDHKIGSNRSWIYGGAGVAGLFLFGGTILAAVKMVVSISAWGFLLGLLIGVGYAAYKMLPRWDLQLANAEKLRVQTAMNAFIEAKQREVNRAVEAKMQEEHRRIEALKDEVRKNPIPFLEANYHRRQEAYGRQKKVVTEIAGKMRMYQGKMRKAKEDNPSMDLSIEIRDMERMGQFHQNRLDRLQSAHAVLDKVWVKLQRARIQWDLKLTAMQTLAEEDRARFDFDLAFQEVLEEVAFDEVSSQYEMVFAQIEVDNLEMTTKRLEFGASAQIDLTSLNLGAATPELVPAVVR